MAIRPLLCLLALLAACESASPPSPPPPPPPPAFTGPVRVVPAASTGDVAPLVLVAANEAAAEHRRLLVYVGAAWCEPCVAFHHAATQGALDAALPGLTVLEFDADLDNDRLVAAGYESKFIPLFVVPGPDGRASTHATSGAPNGVDYVANLAPRIRALFEPAP